MRPTWLWSKGLSVQFSSVAQSCLTLCDPMNCSTPGLPVHHQLPEFTQTHVHRVILECKSRKSRNTWSNRQIWPWNTQWSRAKTNRVLPRKCTGHNKHPLPTTQEKTLHITSPVGQYWNQSDYIICSQRWRSSIQSAKRRLGPDCGSDHELLIVKFRLQLRKVGKTTRPFRYELPEW